MFKRQQLINHTIFFPKEKSPKKRDNIIISTAFITFIGYFFTYMYELGFLSYYGVPEDFIQITLDELCRTLISVFIVFWICIPLFALSFIGNKTLKTILALLFIICVFVLLYTAKKTFNSNHEDYSVYSLIVFGVVGIVANLFSRLGENMNILFRTNKLQNTKKTISAKDSILISVFFILFTVSIMFLGKCIGHLSAEGKNTYSILNINNDDYAMIKYLKDGHAIFIKILNDQKFLQGNYRIIDLNSIAIPMQEEKATLHKIKIDYKNK